jgi:diguanylate cyclase (GGDEF)-like protein
MPSDVQLALGRVGTYTQLGGVVLLALLFASLLANRRRLRYVRLWSAAWVCLLVAIAAVAVRYSDIDLAGNVLLSHRDESDPIVRILYVTYISGKFAFFCFLFEGTRAYTGGSAHRVRFGVILPAALVLAAWVATLSPNLNQIMVWQSIVAAPVYAVCGWRLMTMARVRRSWGSVALASAFFAHGALWLFYLSLFGARALSFELGAFAQVLMYNSFVDALFQTILGYGMVILAVEDTGREIQVAHSELAAAHDALRRTALFDPLTGALNRLAFAEGLGLEHAGAVNGAVAVIDLDNLKPVNDSHGHDIGDALIRLAADAVTSRLRSSDKLYRWGGDEFLVLLPGSSAADANRLLREALDSREPLQHGRVAVALQASVGTADYAGRHDLERAISDADRAMYQRKLQRKSGAMQAVS